MTNSEARKRMQARSGPESPLSRPQTANLGDGANGLLSEAERVDLADAISGFLVGSGYYSQSLTTVDGLDILDYGLTAVVECIVREHTERAWDEAVRECHDLGWMHDFARSDALDRNPYRAARQEQS